MHRHLRPSFLALAVRTAGALLGTNVLEHRLPATGLVVAVPTRRTVYDDPRIVEGGGIPIDVALDDPAMPALAVAHALRNSASRRSDARANAQPEASLGGLSGAALVRRGA